MALERKSWQRTEETTMAVSWPAARAVKNTNPLAIRMMVHALKRSFGFLSFFFFLPFLFQMPVLLVMVVWQRLYGYCTNAHNQTCMWLKPCTRRRRNSCWQQGRVALIWLFSLRISLFFSVVFFSSVGANHDLYRFLYQSLHNVDFEKSPFLNFVWCSNGFQGDC